MGERISRRTGKTQPPPSQDAFLAALGSAALAIGLVLQDLIKNLIGGMMIWSPAPPG
ncbi:MAG: hypothetical protein QOH35_3338 [Acidobacteriaceae bacterium]|nr:hypothetical protein [Acidobacteriaceae bacterium]